MSSATDYDGTLATDGHVHDATKDALKRLRTSGRKLILVTGRELDDLQRTFPELDLFDYVVAENGAVLIRVYNYFSHNLVHGITCVGVPVVPHVMNCAGKVNNR